MHLVPNLRHLETLQAGEPEVLLAVEEALLAVEPAVLKVVVLQVVFL